MSLAKALLEVQKELPAIEPDAVNPHFKNKYVSLDRLLAVCLPILHRHGVVLSQWPTYASDGTSTLTTILTHAESGEKMEASMALILEKENSQGLGSAITYGRRYMLAAALGVSGEKDDDGEAASKPVKAKTEKPAKPAVPRGEKMRIRIQELAVEADAMRVRTDKDADGNVIEVPVSRGTTWDEITRIIAWDHAADTEPLTWDTLTEERLEWLGGELKAYVDGGCALSFYDHVTLPF